MKGMRPQIDIKTNVGATFTFGGHRLSSLYRRSKETENI
jgi:hypothetical protein